MKEFIEYIVRQIVSHPDAVAVEELEEGGTFIYTISVDKEDMGTVIGKEGRNIKSIRNMAKAKAIRDDIRISVNIKEDDRENVKKDDSGDGREDNKEDDKEDDQL